MSDQVAIPCSPPTTMDFTQLYKQSSFLVAFSPGAQFILTAVQDRIIVRRADSFQITQTWLSNPEPAPSLTKLKSHNTATHNRWVTNIGWSCDSEYILAACAKSNVVHVWKLRDQDWSARIDAGAEGLLRAEWAPDGRTILCFSEWGVKLVSCFCPIPLTHIVATLHS
jgi:WD40 repeat protein